MTAVKAGGLTLTTAQGSTVTIVTSGSTVVTKTVTGALSDVTPNEAVTVTGPQNADGTYTATRIVIGGAGLGGFFGGAAGPPPGNEGLSTRPRRSASPARHSARARPSPGLVL